MEACATAECGLLIHEQLFRFSSSCRYRRRHSRFWSVSRTVKVKALASSICYPSPLRDPWPDRARAL